MKMNGFVKQALCTLFIVMAYPTSATNERATLKIAMLHLDLKYADLNHNANLVETGVELAAQQGADWVMTPEPVFTGYRFDLKIGTDWIPQGPDQYVQRMQRLAKQYKVVIFFSHLERESVLREGGEKNKVFNTLFVIDRNGDIVGRHRKINTIPVAESWSTAGIDATVVTVDQQKVGLLICADALPSDHAKRLNQKGANIILSSASWTPGEYGPADTWEKRSFENGLPLFVNNRTGIERQFDLRKSVSAVSHLGERLLSHKSPASQVLLIDWNARENRLVNHSKYARKLK